MASRQSEAVKRHWTATRLAGEHARRAGVDVRLDVFPDMLHTFQMAAGRALEADEAIRKTADWVRPKLGLSMAGGVRPPCESGARR